MYKIVEILVAFVPSIALLALALSFDVELYYFVTALSILILLLQLVSAEVLFPSSSLQTIFTKGVRDLLITKRWVFLSAVRVSSDEDCW